MDLRIGILSKIYEVLCCLAKRHKDCSDPMPVAFCDGVIPTPVLEIEKAYIGDWENILTGQEVRVSIQKDENTGDFLHYEVHGDGVRQELNEADFIAKYRVPIPKQTMANSFPLCGEC